MASSRLSWQSKLLRWYRRHRRDLPWRRRPTPYRVLVSEIMLQQTTVKTVIPYYQRFLKRFPSLKSLADASEQDVLAEWSGLGYYSRARNLHKTAQQCSRNRGRIPKEAGELQELPGIGAYTAGAIASIAYDTAAPIVDGNVARVLSRLFCMKADPKTPQGLKEFWTKAREVMWPHDSGDYNQALMELGATVCTPTRPSCLLCPLQKDCQASQTDDPSRYPFIKKRTKYRNVRLSSALIHKQGSYLMIQRPEQGVLRKMWEFPTIEGDIDELLTNFDLKLPAGESLKAIRHGIMDQRIQIAPWLFQLKKTRSQRWPTGSRWYRPEEIRKLPTSSMNLKLLNLIEN